MTPFVFGVLVGIWLSPSIWLVIIAAVALRESGRKP